MNIGHLSDKDLSVLRDKLISKVPEASILNKDLETEVLLEIFGRTSAIDDLLFARTFYSTDDLTKFSPLYSLRCNFIEPVTTAIDAGCTILILGSKFGNFISSQEFVCGVLDSISPSIDIILASTSKISPSYQSRFKTFELINARRFLEILDSQNVDKIVDLTGTHNELIRLVSGEIDILNPWGSLLPGGMANSSIIWPELLKYRRFWRGRVMRSANVHMYLPPESKLRSFPTICGNAFNGELKFGAFCRTAKLNLKVIKHWILVLRLYPKSTLTFAFLQSNPASESYVKALFGKLGVQSDRVSFIPRVATRDYLNLLNSIHINLGAMPEQGGISCMDSLIMGCPYIVCDELSNSMSSSLVLSELGLDNWRARTINDYYQIIEYEVERISITSDPTFRSAIRDKVLRSDFKDAKRIAEIWSDFFRLL